MNLEAHIHALPDERKLDEDLVPMNNMNY